MRFFSSRHVHVIPLFLVLVFGFVTTSTGAEASRDVLWHIVSTCIDRDLPHYCEHCAAPRVDSTCGQGRVCRETTEVWEETIEYVAIRDRKMCGCEAGFVHGLAMSRTRIIGVEDARRPDGIWAFAWTAAKKRIDDVAAIALAVNPANSRGQDQLHVHIVRLMPKARERFVNGISARVHVLADVWSTAAKKAKLAGLNDYGVLVTKEPDGDFLVLIEEKSPEKGYTVWECQ